MAFTMKTSKRIAKTRAIEIQIGERTPEPGPINYFTEL